ncbi:MAG: poly-gamma-glutamate hydrolase family protein [Ilumatobacteraceae bacterium]
MARPSFADLLALPGVSEECILRGTFGFMAYHGGGLEAMTDVIARAAAERSGASYYGVVHPPDWELHIPSTRVTPTDSPRMASFIDHVDVVVTVHGFGRRSLMTGVLLGGRNRQLARHVAAHLRAALPAYDIIDDLEEIPPELRGVHERNPVNLPSGRGVQIELPPRVRGSSPLWWDWEGGLTPHTEALIDALAGAATSYGSGSDRTAAGRQ